MSEDLSAFFADDLVATDVVVGAITTRGVFDLPDEMLGGGLVVSSEYQLLIKASDVVGLKAGDPLTVAGVAYEVRQVRKLDDGALARLLLAKA